MWPNGDVAGGRFPRCPASSGVVDPGSEDLGGHDGPGAGSITAMGAREVVPDAVKPDTKDWTWVLERPCAECGFDAADVDPADLAQVLRANAEAWVQVLRRPEVGRRPAPGVWSPLEYGCHVRDVHRTMRSRVVLMLEQEMPTFANWDQDATALADRYGEQGPATVSDQLVAAAEAAASVYEQVTGLDWDRVGLRDNGSRFTVASLGRYHLHDVVHHLGDVAAG